MGKDQNQDDAIERVVHEVRRTTLKPDIQTERFVFEKYNDGWHVHFAAATNYSLTQMQEIVEIMKGMADDGRLITIEEQS